MLLDIKWHVVSPLLHSQREGAGRHKRSRIQCRSVKWHAINQGFPKPLPSKHFLNQWNSIHETTSLGENIRNKFIYHAGLPLFFGIPNALLLPDIEQEKLISNDLSKMMVFDLNTSFRYVANGYSSLARLAEYLVGNTTTPFRWLLKEHRLLDVNAGECCKLDVNCKLMFGNCREMI